MNTVAGGIITVAGTFIAVASIGWFFGKPSNDIENSSRGNISGVRNSTDENRFWENRYSSRVQQRDATVLASFPKIYKQLQDLIEKKNIDTAFQEIQELLNNNTLLPKTTENGYLLILKAQILEIKKAFGEAKDCYLRAFKIFEEKSTDVREVLNLSEQIFLFCKRTYCRSQIPTDEAELLKWAEETSRIAKLLPDKRSGAKAAEPVTVFDKMGNSRVSIRNPKLEMNKQQYEIHANIATNFMELTMYSTAEEYWIKALKYCTITHISSYFPAIFSLAYCLFYQRKVDMAISHIQAGKTDILKKIGKSRNFVNSEIRNQELACLVYQLLSLQAMFLFWEERYSECEETLLEASQTLERFNIPVEPQLKLHKACCAWELGDEVAAKGYFADLKNMAARKLDLGRIAQIRSRSKLLQSVEASVEHVYGTESGSIFKLSLVTNLVSVSRQGIPDALVPRAIQCPFYIEVHFESTKPNSAPIIINQEVTLKEFQITSPIISPHATFTKLYEITIFIFKEKEKKKCLGVHHELIYTLIPARKIGINN